MSYEMNVQECSLINTDGVRFYDEHLNFPEDWEIDAEVINFTGGYFVSSVTDNMLADFSHFQQDGVRGHFTVYGEQGEWIKYVLDDEGVQELNATLLWGDELDVIRFTFDDIHTQADGLFEKKVIRECMKDKKLLQNILNTLTERFLEQSWEEVLQEIIIDKFSAKLVTLK